MNAQKGHVEHYAIKEVSKLSGLPESTLRYYETIGIIDFINRDPSSKHRVYDENDLNTIIGIACLNITGMSIGDIRTYLENFSLGAKSAGDQIALLENHERRLAEEAHYLKLRRKYIAIKIEYWNAIASKDQKRAELITQDARRVAVELKAMKK